LLEKGLAMPIITISRGSYSKGKEVAEKVAERLGYKCVAREIILSASKEFNIPEIKFARAIHDAPSIFDRVTYGREKYTAYLQAAFLKGCGSSGTTVKERHPHEILLKCQAYGHLASIMGMYLGNP